MTTLAKARTEGDPDRAPSTAADQPLAKAKKVYRKPELFKHEQLHGIGIGTV